MPNRFDSTEDTMPRDSALVHDDLRSVADGYDQPGSEARTIHVRLTPKEHLDLRRRARAAGIRPWDLARHWLVAQLDRPKSGGGYDLPYEMHDLTAMLLEQRDIINQLFRRLDRLEMGAARSPLETSLGPRRQVGPATSVVGDRQTAMGPHPKLHDEILAVLHESDAPLTSEAIANAVTRRGRYRPRSGHAISPAAISGRIANPRYRGLFHRDGRLIVPASRGA